MTHKWLRWLVVVVVIPVAACASKKASSTAPCDVFTSADAKDVLGKSALQRLSASTLIKLSLSQTTETTSAAEAAQVSGLDATSCTWGTGATLTSRTATYQFQFAAPGFFSSADDFLKAFDSNPGFRQVNGVGRAAAYFRDSTLKSSSISVLMPDGRNFAVRTVNATATENALIAVARTILRRLPAHAKAASTGQTVTTLQDDSPLTAPPGPALDDYCNRHFASTSTPNPPLAEFNSSPRTYPVSFEVAVSPTVVCPGGEVRIAVRAHNESDKTQAIFPAPVLASSAGEITFSVSMQGGSPMLGPHQTETQTGTFNVPLTTPPGRYTVTWSDHDANDRPTTLTVRAPS